ncbi:M23 family metallopeptidase [Prosthecochloris sp. ZM_2]|uniref:M23 family metallopeptidase n=1 Tax=Prosthecochloris sp. ZM_2 TaxID=2045206 RepID=UPI000DF7C896|nr:M23 family metallopeptidase [Prosthecochloris sp. ZM_2]RNA64159.1 M23 family metallopeptidase [Prosthecochloris sp. ZM_2]
MTTASVARKTASILLVLLLLLGTARSAMAETPDLALDSTTREQGEFFIATVTGLDTPPRLWFDSTLYTMFRQPDGSFRALLPVKALQPPGRYAVLAINDTWKEKIPVQVTLNDMPVQKIWLDKKTSGLRATKDEKRRVKEGLSTRSERKLWSGTFMMPAQGRKSSPFGVKRSYNGAPVSSYHKGIDIAAPQGTVIRSPASGKVVLTGYESKTFHVHGNTVLIDHGHAVTSIYLHMHDILVQPGDIVSKGDPIGTIGSTGISTGPHLHWGVYLYGTSVNPELFVRNAY